MVIVVLVVHEILEILVSIFLIFSYFEVLEVIGVIESPDLRYYNHELFDVLYVILGVKSKIVIEKVLFHLTQSRINVLFIMRTTCNVIE